MVRVLLSPRMLVLHLVAVVGVVGTAWLGVWQYGAWQDHREDKAAELAGTKAVPLGEVLGPDDAFPARYVGQPVTFAGTWLPDDTVYVDKGDGFWVVTPVAVDTGSAMLVVRGSSKQPHASAPAGPVSVRGWVQPGESGSVADDDPSDDVLPSVRIADVLERMDQDLYSGYVIADQPREAGLTPVTPDELPAPGALTAIRNLLYALEWWVFGTFGLFLWWRWCTDEIQRAKAQVASTT